MTLFDISTSPDWLFIHFGTIRDCRPFVHVLRDNLALADVMTLPILYGMDTFLRLDTPTFSDRFYTVLLIKRTTHNPEALRHNALDRCDSQNG